MGVKVERERENETDRERRRKKILTNKEPISNWSNGDCTVKCSSFMCQCRCSNISTVWPSPNCCPFWIDKMKVTFKVRHNAQVIFNFDWSKSVPCFMKYFVSLVFASTNIDSSINKVSLTSQIEAPIDRKSLRYTLSSRRRKSALDKWNKRREKERDKLWLRDWDFLGSLTK